MRQPPSSPRRWAASPRWSRTAQTGLLVPPGDHAALAGAINALVARLRPGPRSMGGRGRERAVAEFGWAADRRADAALYAELAAAAARLRRRGLSLARRHGPAPPVSRVEYRAGLLKIHLD